MKSNTVILIVITLLIAGGIYWYVSTGTGNQAPLTASTSNNAAQTQFQTLVGELQPISFNTTLFSDPKFTSLVDITTPVAPEPSARIDPFAPIPGVTGM